MDSLITSGVFSRLNNWKSFQCSVVTLSLLGPNATTLDARLHTHKLGSKQLLPFQSSSNHFLDSRTKSRPLGVSLHLCDHFLRNVIYFRSCQEVVQEQIFPVQNHWCWSYQVLHKICCDCQEKENWSKPSRNWSTVFCRNEPCKDEQKLL